MCQRADTFHSPLIISLERFLLVVLLGQRCSSHTEKIFLNMTHHFPKTSPQFHFPLSYLCTVLPMAENPSHFSQLNKQKVHHTDFNLHFSLVVSLEIFPSSMLISCLCFLQNYLLMSFSYYCYVVLLQLLDHF